MSFSKMVNTSQPVILEVNPIPHIFSISTGISGAYDEMANFHDEGPSPSLAKKRISTFNPVLVIANNQAKTD